MKIRKIVIDVLEGTMQAFDIRRLSTQKHFNNISAIKTLQGTKCQVEN